MSFRLVNASGRATLALEEDRGIDIARASDGAIGPGLMDALAHGADLHALTAAGADREGALVPIDADTLGCPVPAPGQVFGIGLNYRSHAEESGMAIPSLPMVFTKFPSSVCGPNDEILLPTASVDWEVELVAVVGRAGRDIAEADALGHLAGFTVGQDLSERMVQFASNPAQFSMGKSYATFGPIGPAVVSLDSFADPASLELWCEIDGERMQDGRTDDLIFSVSELVSYLSSICELRVGDLIFTGTPAGVGFTRQPPRFLADGELLVTHVEGIGSMRNRCRRLDDPCQVPIAP
jgi:2,4-diketo-3-deoxy-L-fuconate hydrolase